MVHFELQEAKVRFQEHFFYDETRKNKDGFALINVTVPHCKGHVSNRQAAVGSVRTLVTGVNNKSNRIYEYVVGRNEIEEVFKASYCMQDFSQIVYQGNKIILTGGSECIVQLLQFDLN